MCHECVKPGWAFGNDFCVECDDSERFANWSRLRKALVILLFVVLVVGALTLGVFLPVRFPPQF